MLAEIQDCIWYVFQNEGGYAEPPQAEQPTNFGIILVDLAAYRQVPVESLSAEDMKSLSKMESTEIYRTQFWDKMRLSEIDCQEVATALFDVGVNRGVPTCAKYAQKIVSTPVDGIFGPKTLLRINLYNPAQFIKNLERMVWSGYEAIIAHNPEKQQFEKGWLSRAERLLTLTASI